MTTDAVVEATLATAAVNELAVAYAEGREYNREAVVLKVCNDLDILPSDHGLLGEMLSDDHTVDFLKWLFVVVLTGPLSVHTKTSMPHVFQVVGFDPTKILIAAVQTYATIAKLVDDRVRYN